MPELIITKDIDAPGLDTLEGYRKLGGYQALEKALTELQPDEIIEMVKKSGLRGRGERAFPQA
jgi:NADH-quinone oxidoreductase subunit F